MKIERLDHLVLTVADIEHSVRFYGQTLGMERINFAAGRVALAFGQQKINLHQSGSEFTPHAVTPTPGSADLCFITAERIDAVHEHLTACGITVIEGPVARTGARGPIVSLYFRDPDGNLIEVSRYSDPAD